VNLLQTKADFKDGKIQKHDYIRAMHQSHRALFDFSELIRSTDVSKIEITDHEVVMTIRSTGVRFACDPEDQRIAPIEILNFDRYEESDALMMRQLVDPGQTLLDIGANFGWYSLNLAKWIPDLTIHAFEPIPKTFGYLKRNLELNDMKNIRIHNFGFSKEAEQKVFYFYPEGSGNASLANLSERADAEEIVCQIRTLDEVASEQRLAVDFIKCDVEGAELFVFQGGIETLCKQQPLVLTEMLRKWAAKFDYHPNQLIELFTEIGYRCFTAEQGGLKEFSRVTEDTTETNYFFLHNVRHADKIARWCL
jgi:FkbM family methyltransferase